MNQDCPSLERLESHVEGPVPPDLEGHLLACDRCRSAMAEIRANRDFLAKAFPRPDAHAQPDSASQYVLGPMIARGGQGVVYRATHAPTQRAVAVKMLTGGIVSTPRQRARFEREIEIAASIRHPNVVTLYDAWATPDGGIAYAMELIDGRPLHEWAATLGHTHAAVHRILELFIHVCEGVFAAHQRGIIHRDLKPGNIFVDPDDQPHVLDFGIATRSHTHASTLTRTDEFAGTLAYAAPEQVSASGGGVDTRTDVYALGVVLYELLVGRLPYSTDGPIEDLVHRITRQAPAPMDGGPRPIPADVRVVVLKALAKERERRYATARQLGEELRRALDGRAIEARRDSRWYVLRKTARRHRWALAGLAGAAALVLGSAVAIERQRGAARLAVERARFERLRAETDSRTAQAAVRLLGDLLPDRTGDDMAAIGRDALARQGRSFTLVSSGLMAADPQLGPTGLWIFSALGRSPASAHVAELALRQALPELYARHGPTHLEVARVWHELGAVLNLRERPAEARLALGRALEIRRALLGARAEPVARTAVELARSELALGQAERARELLDETIGWLGEADPEGGAGWPAMADALAVRSEVLERLGASPEAVARDAVGALAIRLETLPDWDPEVWAAIRRVARLCRSAPGCAALEPVRTVMGVEGSAAERLESLAGRLGLAPDRLGGSFGEAPADPMLVEASVGAVREMVRLKAALLGRGALATGRTLLLGATYASSAAFSGLGAEMAEEAASIFERRLGPRHVALATCLQVLATCRIDMQEFEAGMAALERVRAIWSGQPEGSVDPFSMANLTRWIAYYSAHSGRAAEAERLYLEAEEGARRHAQPGHYLVGVCQVGRGWAVGRLGRLEEGESLIREGLRLLPTDLSDPRSDQLLLARAMLGEVLARRGRDAEAREELRPMVELIVRKRLGSVGAREAVELMAEVEGRLGNAAERDRLLAASAEILERARRGGK